ncbi:protein Atg16l2 [Rhinophrynus dorsalis]
MDQGRAPGAKADWKHHITRQLKHRDRTQKTLFQDVIQSYNKLLEKSSLLKHLAETIQTEPIGSPGTQTARSPEDVPGSPASEDIRAQQWEKEELENYNGELAYEACELRKRIQERDDKLKEQITRMDEVSEYFTICKEQQRQLEDQVVSITCANSFLKDEYDKLLSHSHELEEELKKKNMQHTEMINDMIKRKEVEAEKQNQLNERRKKEMWTQQIKKALRKTLSVEGSQSMIALGSSRFMGALRNLFDANVRREIESPYSGEIWYRPSMVCVICCLPKRALFNKEVHESEVHAVQFSPSSRMVATGGADRVIKLWRIEGGALQIHQTLEGSRGGITSIEFDPSGTKILASSYDGAAHLWKLDGKSNESLTGHKGKVTAAKFKMNLHRAVTCGLDRTVREWDLQKAACLRSISVSSYCSDVVCSDNYMISGHHDKKIRYWDSRSVNCIREVTLEDKITSLYLHLDQSQLLSCSRDDVLSLIDMRTNNILQVFRAEGFKCGCDWTKAILSPDGSYTIAGSADGTVYIWNARTGLLERSLNGQHRASVNAVTWSMSGDYVVSVDRGRTAVLWSEY